MSYFITSPLDQFEVVNLISVVLPIFGFLNIALTNLGLYAIVAFVLVVGLHSLANNNYRLVPSKWSILLESLYASLLNIVRSQIGASGESYFPFIYSLFIFILFSNLVANVPYNYAISTSIITSIGYSLAIFIGVTVLSLSIHKVHFFSSFVPGGTPVALVPLLVWIETVTYFARGLSLGVRLFANLVAGHTLLAILSSLLSKLFSYSLLVAALTLIPFAIFTALIGLELAVSFIQAYVFCLLTSSYIKTAIDLH